MAYVPTPATDDEFSVPSSLVVPPSIGIAQSAQINFDNALSTTPEAVIFDKLIQSGESEEQKKDTVDSMRDQQLQKDYLLENQNNNVFKWTGNHASSLLGSLMSPITLATGGAADSLVKGVAEDVLPKLLTSGSYKTAIAARAVQTGLGAAEGAIAITPMAASAKEYSDMIGEPESNWGVALNIANGAAFGGVLRGVFGFRNVIKPFDEDTIVQTVKNQIEGGKQVNFDSLMKNALYQADKEDPATIEQITAQKEINDKLKTSTKKEFDLAQSAFDEASKNYPETQPTKINGIDLVNQALEIQRVPENERTSDQIDFMNNLPQTDEIKAAIVLKSLSEDQRNISQQKFLDRFEQGNEKEIIQERIQTQQDQIDKIKDVLRKNKDELEEDQTSSFVSARNELENSLTEGTKRLKVLNKLDKEPEKIKSARNRLIKAKERYEYHQKIDKDLDAWAALKTTDTSPVTKDSVQSSYENQKSYTSNDTVNIAQDEVSDKQAKDIEEEAPTDENIEQKAKDFQDRLEAVDKDALDRVDADEIEATAHISLLKKGLDQAKKCLLGIKG